MSARSRIRFASSAILLAVMVLGGASHLWHHVVDPDCTAEGRHGTIPCATCASLHHPVAPADATPCIAPTPSVVVGILPVQTAHHWNAAVLVASPRAPPHDA